MTEQTYTLIIGADDFAACPKCGVRLDLDMDGAELRVVDEDDDGPVYLGTCMEHGAFRYQFEKESDEVEEPKRKVDLLERRFLVGLSAEETAALVASDKASIDFEGMIWRNRAVGVYVETADEEGHVLFSVDVNPVDGSDCSQSVIAGIEEFMDELTGRKAEEIPMWGMF